MARIVVDPVTRIEGHLRIEAEVKGRAGSDAWSAGTMVRGIEMILRGRDPREAWIWTGASAACARRSMPLRRCAPSRMRWASIPRRCRIDPEHHLRQPIRAGPCRPFLPAPCAGLGGHNLRAQGRSGGDVADGRRHFAVAQVQPRIFRGHPEPGQGLVESRQLRMFTSAYWGHPAYSSHPRSTCSAVAHYLEALEFQRD